MNGKKPADYDEAVKLLGDLRDLGSRSGRSAEVQDRIQRIRDEHAKKPSFVGRLQRARLIAPEADGPRRPQPLAPARNPR